MTRAELMREIRRLRADAAVDFLNIVKAMESGELPQSAKGTYFYQTYVTQSTPRQSGVKASNRFIKGGITKLKKKDLERYVTWLQGFENADTRTVVGVKNRLQEMEDSARAVLETYEISSKGMTREDLSYYFQIVTLLNEISSLPSDEAIRATQKLRTHNRGYSLEEIFNTVKMTNFDPRVAERDNGRWKLRTW